MSTRSRITAVLLLALALPASALAQFKNGNQTVLLNLPRVSQRAVLIQRIGLTDVSIVYHRPQVGGRKIFGDIVSYGRVWRAGANDNTTIEFTDPVTIEGQPLAAGRYGLHMIPGQTEWTIIFSKNSTSWGSFSYDPKEDALRVRIRPVAIAPQEMLTYEFSDLKQDAATLALQWETVRVSVSIGVDTKNLTLASLRREMRHLAGYKPESFYEAAMYCLDNDFNYDEALGWVDQAIQMDERFENLELKSLLLDRAGRHDEAHTLHARALKIASPEQLYGLGDRLLREKRLDDAKAFFEKLTREHPEAWNNWYGLARVQVAQGDRAAAKRTLETSEKYASTPQQKAGVKRLLERLAAGQSIG